MDFWVVVAAATAGCLTKYVKSSRRSFKGYYAAINGGGYVDCLAHGKKLDRDPVVSQTGILEGKMSDCASTAEVPCTSGVNETVMRDLADCDFLSIASVPMEYAESNTSVERENGNADREILSGLVNGEAENSGGRTCSFRGSVKIDNTFRSRCQHMQVKPLTSLDSCLLAQLYNHHTEQKVHSHSSPRPPASSTARLDASGNNIISWRSDGFVQAHVATELHLAGSGSVIGIPPLPRIKKLQTKHGGSSARQRKFSTQHGEMCGVIMFSLGVYTGVLSCVSSKKTEVDKLKESLKQSENLVQDLQEELEMKDSLIVKELDSDFYGSQFTRQTSFLDVAPTSSSYEQLQTNIPKVYCYPRLDENVDSMSKIEAELEAELGRLGLNVRCCNVQLNKVDISGRNCAKDGSSSSSTAPSTNYSVSPRALTLRLHEVIQSRLEERIQELELALENSQRKVRLLESAQKSRSGRRLFNGMARPVVVNLSDEAMSAHDEACEEFTMFDSSEDNSPSYRYNYLPKSAKPNGIEEKLWAVNGRMPQEPRETLSGAQEIDSFGMSRDESSDAEDELLIRQLVERTKKGSPAKLLLFSDQDDRQ